MPGGTIGTAEAPPAPPENRPIQSRPHKIMGADIAAGPHCPCTSDPAGKARHSRRAVSRNGTWTEVPAPPPPGVRPQPKLLQAFPAGSPSGPKPWRFAAWRIRNRSSSSHPGGSFGRNLRFRVRRDSKPKLLFRLTSPWTCVLGPCRFAAPGPKPGPARQIRSRSSFLAGGSARTEVPPSAGLVLDPKVRCPAYPVPRARRPSVPGGRFTKPAAFAFAEGQARHRPPGGGFVSRPAVRFHPPCHPKAAGPMSTWAVAGKATLRCRRIVLATTHSCHEKWRRKSPIWLWITRITCITSRVPERRIDTLAPAAAPA